MQTIESDILRVENKSDLPEDREQSKNKWDREQSQINGGGGTEIKFILY